MLKYVVPKLYDCKLEWYVFTVLSKFKFYVPGRSFDYIQFGTAVEGIFQIGATLKLCYEALVR